MSYPFVQAYHDAGPARGPRLGFVVHMAEGGGTVGFLSRQNPNGVSVHYVIESTGRTVQMLREDHMHTSIRATALRTTNDADGFYGSAAAQAVLGVWARTDATLGPNHATLAVEIEGFAAAGPNAAQRDALAELVRDIRSRHPLVGNLGHRDFADYKACPGKLIPWDRIGGHGLYQEDDMPLLEMKPASTDTGVAIVRPTGSHYILADNRRVPAAGGLKRNVLATYRLAKPLDAHAGDRQTLLAVSVPQEPGWGFLLAADTDWPVGKDVPPVPDCSGEVKAGRESMKAAVLTAVEGVPV